MSGKLERDSAPALLRELKLLSHKTTLTEAELLLSWAYDCLHGILISSTSREDRLRGIAKLLLGNDKVAMERSIYDRIEKAAKEDGCDGKTFYKHSHMDAAGDQEL